MKQIKKYKIEMQPGKQLAGSEFDKESRCHAFMVAYGKKYISRLYLVDQHKFKYVPGIPVTIYEN